MAFPAIGVNHFSRVWFVALGALRDLPVDTVTGGAVQGGMLALITPELRDLLCMAGETSIRDIACKWNIQGCVGICVTVEAASDSEMSLSHVALWTLGNGFLYCRRMSDMAAKTSDSFVLSAGGC
jgi:hypothetical protein